jgi:hypothetical protein
METPVPNARLPDQRLHKAVLEETDPQKLRQGIFELENALFLRAQQLLDTSDHHQERADMLQASDDLLRVKTQLGWPKPNEAGA